MDSRSGDQHVGISFCFFRRRYIDRHAWRCCVTTKRTTVIVRENLQTLFRREFYLQHVKIIYQTLLPLATQAKKNVSKSSFQLSNAVGRPQRESLIFILLESTVIIIVCLQEYHLKKTLVEKETIYLQSPKGRVCLPLSGIRSTVHQLYCLFISIQGPIPILYKLGIK